MGRYFGKCGFGKASFDTERKSKERDSFKSTVVMFPADQVQPDRNGFDL